MGMCQEDFNKVSEMRRQVAEITKILEEMFNNHSVTNFIGLAQITECINSPMGIRFIESTGFVERNNFLLRVFGKEMSELNVILKSILQNKIIHLKNEIAKYIY